MNETDRAALALRLAVASHYNSEAADQWQCIRRDLAVDWQLTTQYALRLGFAPLLFHALRQDPEFTVPEDVKTRLEQAYYKTAMHNSLALHQLGAILETLNDANIDLLLLKGSALLEPVYQNIALRPMVDMDLLILFKQLGETLSSLASIGYVSDQPFPFKDESGLFWNEVLLQKSDEVGFQLELHWQLIDIPYYASRFSTDKLLASSYETTIDGRPARVLCPEHLILHLCMHNLYHHLGHMLRSVVDVGFIIEHYSDKLDWRSLVEQAIEYDIVLATKITLQEAATAWYARVPDEILDQLSSSKARGRERFFLSAQRSEFSKVFRTFITLPGLGLKSRFLWGQMFPDRQYMAWRYGTAPATPLPLAYLRRYTSGIKHLVGEATRS